MYGEFLLFLSVPVLSVLSFESKFQKLILSYGLDVIVAYRFGCWAGGYGVSVVGRDEYLFTKGQERS